MKKLILGILIYLNICVSFLFAQQKINVNQILNFKTEVVNAINISTNLVIDVSSITGLTNFVNSIVSTNRGMLVDGSLLSSTWDGTECTVWITNPSGTHSNKIGKFYP